MVGRETARREGEGEEGETMEGARGEEEEEGSSLLGSDLGSLGEREEVEVVEGERWKPAPEEEVCWAR